MASSLASKETAHHVYRALLRAASYLPASETRQWVAQRITDRFRRKSEMTHKQHKDAQQILGQLTRATYGHIPALQKVFSYTYARSGPRRRALLSSTIDLLHSSDLANPPPHPPKYLAPMYKSRVARLSPAHNRGGGLTLPTKEPSPFLTAYQRFLDDQERCRPRNLLGRNWIKFVDPPIPQTSIWERPTALKLERGIVKRWVGEGLDNVVPPLPAKEWDYLRAVALGHVAPEQPPKRRTKVGERKEETSMLTLENLKFSIRHTQQEVLRNRKDAFSHHKITPKFLQRLYASIWLASPKMTWNGETRKWVYTWGSKMEPKKRDFKPVPRDRQLFKGLENLPKSERAENGKKTFSEKREERMRGKGVEPEWGIEVVEEKAVESRQQRLEREIKAKKERVEARRREREERERAEKEDAW